MIEVSIVGPADTLAGVPEAGFEEFVNLQEAEILGYVEGVERSLGTVASLDINWKDPAELAEHLRSGSYVEIKRGRSWSDWN